MNQGGDTCKDFAGEYDPGNPLHISHTLRVGGLINGVSRSTNGAPFGEFKDYPCDRYKSLNFSHILLDDVPTDSGLATQLVGETNPFRTYVSIPLYLFELRELPSLFKSYGDSIIKGAAKGVLTNSFSIRPLVSDLWKLHNFANESAKRSREFEKLHKDGYLVRKRQLFATSASLVNEGVEVNTSNRAFFTGREVKVTQLRTWGYVVWKTTSLFPKPEAEALQLMNDAMRGMTLTGFAGAWNALPWSWLIDYFINIGDFLESQDGKAYVYAAECQLMTDVTTTLACSPEPPYPGISISPFHYKWTERIRRRAIPGLSLIPDLNALSSNQEAILLALAANKARYLP
jgi:hypothetical protein